MSAIDNAVQFMINTANDSSHGYAQDNRWGPDYDCSSLVITAYQQAGIKVKDKGATYTGNMEPAFLACGFKNVTSSVNLSTGSGMLKGDVLLNVRNHTAMFIGDGKIAQASSNEKGGIVGGKVGDQTGGEINVRSYYNFPWNIILRLPTSNTDTPTTSGEELNSTDTYTVKRGDTLYGIAERLLGSGTYYERIMKLNGLKTTTIHIGQVLKISGAESSSTNTEVSTSSSKTTTVSLPELTSGDENNSVKVLQIILIGVGYTLPLYGADGQFGGETLAAVKKFQTSNRLTPDGVVGKDTWSALLT